MAGMSPTQRTIKELKNQGVRCGIVEKWVAWAKKPGQAGPPGIRVDFLGIIDVIAISSDGGVIGIQCCGSDFSSHFRKLTEENAQATTDWLKCKMPCPNCGALCQATGLQIWSWRKIKKVRGGKAMIWQPRIREITLEDVK